MNHREAVEAIAAIRRMNRAYLFGLLRDNGESVASLLAPAAPIIRPAEIGRQRRAAKAKKGLGS